MKLILPKLSATMEEGTIGKWYKQAGDSIREGDVLYEVETDKTTMDVESSVTGTLEQILVESSQTIPTGTVVCMIRTANEERESPISVSGSFSPVTETVSDSFDPKADKAKTGMFRASPSARRLAREHGMDIAALSGTGPQGRIRNRDIEAAIKSNISVNLSAHEKPLIAKPGILNVEASSMRKTIARELVRSTQTIPMFWAEKWVNAGELLKWKDLLKNSRDSVFSRLTITDFVLQAIGLALLEMPSVNRRWVVNSAGGISIEQITGSHVGLAISVEGGIIAPILTDAGSVSLLELTRKRGEMVESIRNNRPRTDQETAAITLSNLGNTGVDRFRAIIKPDESMILALGGLREIVAAEQGNMVIQKGFSMILSADHRLIDGVEAARFLGIIAGIIEAGSWKIA